MSVVREVKRRVLDELAEVLSVAESPEAVLRTVFGAVLRRGNIYYVPVFDGRNPTFIAFAAEPGGFTWRFVAPDEEEDVALAIAQLGSDPTPVVRLVE